MAMIGPCQIIAKRLSPEFEKLRSCESLGSRIFFIEMENPNLLTGLGIIEAETIEVTLEDLTCEFPEVYRELQHALSERGIDYCNVSVERVLITGKNLFSGIKELRAHNYIIYVTSRDDIPRKIRHALGHIHRDDANPIKDLLNYIMEPPRKTDWRCYSRGGNIPLCIDYNPPPEFIL